MIIHIAGNHVTVNQHLRQRCAWCGAALIDQDLASVMVPTDQPGPYPTWPVGELVAKDGGMSYTVEHKDGDQLPAEACARLPLAVTRWPVC